MLKILKNFTKKEWGLSACALLFVVAQVWLELTMPDYMSKITVLVQTPGSAMSEILRHGGLMLLCALGSLTASMLTAVCTARIGSNFAAILREKMFKKVQSFSMEEISRFSTASLITRSTNDTTQVLMLIVMGLQVLVKAPIMAVWATAKIVGKSREWSLTTAVAVVVLLLTVAVCIIVSMPKFKRVQTLTDDLNRVTRENLNGLRVIRAYNAEEYQQAKFDFANSELTENQLFTQRTMAFMSPSIQLIMSSLTLAIYWIGAILINSAAMGARVTLFSEMVVFSTYAMQVVMSFMMLVMIFMILPRASVSAARINEVLGTEPTIIDGAGAEGLAGHEGEVEFRKVSFRYPDAEEYVLRDVSFTAHKGETVAFIGATGSGKSTLINLIPRFYDVSEGQVLVDGVDVKDYTQQQLRNKIGFAAQKATLFKGSVRTNVAFGDNGRAPEEVAGRVDEALRIAQADDFVSAMENGADADIAQDGGNLSGGQKQRLSIARAVCRDAEIYVFDDSFSALDYKTDKALRRALDEYCGEATRLIVAQRIGTIRDADRIIVLDEGSVVGSGTHDELMRTCEVYRQIALSQLSEEELA